MKPICSLLFLPFLFISPAHAADPAPASPGAITDAEIRDVISRVARHQIQPLADGDFAKVDSLEKAASARAPKGIDWSYPWGVTLYGMENSTDVTGDKDADNFVVRHNLICARYYTWLDTLKTQFGANAAPLIRRTKLQQFFAL